MTVIERGMTPAIQESIDVAAYLIDRYYSILSGIERKPRMKVGLIFMVNAARCQVELGCWCLNSEVDNLWNSK